MQVWTCSHTLVLGHLISHIYGMANMVLPACDFWNCRCWVSLCSFYTMCTCVGIDFQYHHIFHRIFDLTGILFNLPSSNMNTWRNWWIFPRNLLNVPEWKLPLISDSAAAAKSLQSCPILCDPIDGSPPGSSVPGILQARTLEWVAISFSSACKWKVKVKSLSHVWLLVTPWTAAHQAPPSMGFSRQEYWSGVPSHFFQISFSPPSSLLARVQSFLTCQSALTTHPLL